MIKLLLHHDLFLSALRGDQRCETAIHHALKERRILPWALGDLIQRLSFAGATQNEIESLTKNLALIPLNARLSGEALALGGNFDQALYQKAGEAFKCRFFVSLKGSKLGSLEGMTTDALMDWKEPLPDKVEFLNLTYPIHAVFNQVDGWHMEIIQNTAFAGGKHVAAFEKAFAEYSGTGYAVGVGSGTEALLFSLLAMGIGPGDEVITQPNTFIATTEAIRQAGATVVFADVSRGTWNLDPVAVEKKITAQTKAILPVHLYGQPAELEPLLALCEKHHLELLEDACQAHGARYQGKKVGSWGRAAAFSLYPGKNLGAYGEAGVVTTNDEALAAKIRMIREHGQAQKYYHDIEGYNGRMDNLQAAAVQAKLPHLEGWNNERRQAATWYKELLSGLTEVELPEVAEGAEPVWHLFVIHVPDAQKLHEYLKTQGVFTGFHYPKALHLQKAYEFMGLKEGSFPNAEYNASHLLSLPMFPELGKPEVEKVAREIRQFFA